MELKNNQRGTLGLPLIGTDCEFIGSNACESNHPLLVRGTPVHIIAHYEQNNGVALAAFTFVAGDDEVFTGGSVGSLLRPLRTPEQIAAEFYETKVRSLMHDAGILGSAFAEDPEAMAWAQSAVSQGWVKP